MKKNILIASLVVLALGTNVFAAPTEKFEYEVCRSNSFPHRANKKYNNSNDLSCQKETSAKNLDEMGLKGWKLISVSNVPVDFTNRSEWSMVFIRTLN